MARNNFPNLENVIACISANNSYVRKEDVLHYFKSIVNSGGITVKSLLKKYNISLEEANEAYGSNLLLHLHNTSQGDLAEVVEISNKTVVCEIIAKSGNFRAIQNTIREIDLTRDDILQLAHFIASHNFQMTLKYAIEHFKITREEIERENFFQNAVRNGHLKVLKTLTNLFGFDKAFLMSKAKDSFRVAATNGDLYMVKWLGEKFALTMDDITGQNLHALYGPAKNGELLTLQWIIEHFKITRSTITNISKFFAEIVGDCNLIVIKWMTEYFHITREDVLADETLAFQYAAETDRLGLLRWMVDCFELVKEDIKGNKFQAFYIAVELGHIRTVKWLTERFNLTREDIDICYDRAMKEAKSDEKMHQWLTEKFSSQKEEQSYVSVNAIDFIIETPKDQRLEAFNIILKFGSNLSDSKIKAIIDGVCNMYYLCIPKTMNKNILDIVARVYDFKNKSREEVTKVLYKICDYEMSLFDINLQYLADKDIIPMENPKPQLTVEEAKKLLPGYIIAKPEELMKRFEDVN